MTAALFQLVSHAAFKGCLFLGAGSVQRAAGTRDLDRLGGLARRLPVTAALVGIGALAICALPPFSGFASEWLLLQGLLRGFSAHGAAVAAVLLAGVAALALTGGLTAAAFVKAFGIGFLGQPRTPGAAAAAEVAPSMVAGTALLAVPCLVLGVVPGLVLPVLARAAAARAGFRSGSGAARGDRGRGRQRYRRDRAVPAGRGAAGLARPGLGWCSGPGPGHAGAPRHGAAAAIRRRRGCSTPRHRSPSRCSGSSTTCCAPTMTSRSATWPSHATSRTRSPITAGSMTPSSAAATGRSSAPSAGWGEVARHAQNGSVHRYLGYGFAALVVILVVLA